MVPARIRKLATGHAMLEQIAEAMLAARGTLLEQFNKLRSSTLPATMKSAAGS
jgi:hypothetical protein